MYSRLSSFYVDKLKNTMAFQLSTTDHLKLVSQFASYLQPLHSKASRAVIFGWTRQPSLTLPRWSVRCRRNIYKLQKFQVIVQHIYYIKFTLRFADMQIPELVSVFNRQVGLRSWSSMRAYHDCALIDEFERRGIDTSLIHDGRDLTFSHPVRYDLKENRLFVIN